MVQRERALEMMRAAEQGGRFSSAEHVHPANMLLEWGEADLEDFVVRRSSSLADISLVTSDPRICILLGIPLLAQEYG